MRTILSSGLAIAAAIMAAVAVHAQVEEPGPPRIIHRMNPHQMGLSAPAGSTTATSPITYHGGSVIAAPVVYLIWYGNWNQSNGSDTPAGQQIVRDFANTIGSSPYFNLNTSASAGGFTITGNVTFGPGHEAMDAGSQGTRLRDSSVFAIVIRAINSGALGPF